MHRCVRESVISIYGVNSFTSGWRIASYNSALTTSRAAKIKGLAYSLAQRVQDEDRFDTRERTLVKGLYKSIPTERAEELLNEGVKDEYAVATAVKEYYDSTIEDSINSGSYTASDRELYISDEAGNSTYFDYSSYVDNYLEVHIGDMNDTVDLGGVGNNITLYLDSGDNTVNIDTSQLNTFLIKSGSGVDTVNLSGSAVDYGYMDNLDTTLTLTNLDSGATVTIDGSLDNVVFEDGSTLSFDGSVVDLETSTGSESLTITDDNTTYDINMNGGNDTLDIQGANNDINVSLDSQIDNFVSVAGEDNIVNINLNSGQDTVFVNADSNNQVTINGGDYSDVVILEGDASDWTQTVNTFVNNTSGTSVTVSNVEQIVFGEVIENTEGSESIYDYTASSNVGGIIDLNDMNDTVNLGGDNNYIEVIMNSGDNTVNVDDTNYNKFFVIGGTGNDTLNFSGDVEDYTFQNNDNGTLTVVNVDSGAKTVLDSNIETITFADGSNMIFDGTEIVINSSSTGDTLNITGENNEVSLYTNSGDDNVTVDGTNNKVTIFTGNGDDNIFVAAGDNNEVIVDGGAGTDVLTLQGTAADWVQSGTAVGKTYYDNILTGTRVTLITDVDSIVFDNAVVLNDTLGVSNNYDLTGYNNSTLVVNSAEGNDVITLDGNNNDVTVNLTTGNNTVNIDDTGDSTYVINGGTGTDTVTLTGNVADYTSVTNPDDSVTYTNTITGATITLNPDDIESLIAQDGSIFGPVTINGTVDPDTFDVSTYNDSDINVNTYEGHDTVTAGGDNNSVTIDVGDGNDVINIDDTAVNSTFNIIGGVGTDTVNLGGDLSDYTFVNNGDNTLSLLNNTSGSVTTIDTTVENIVLNDGAQINFDGSTITLTDSTGNSSNIDLTDSNNTTFIVNAGDMDDTIDLGGTGNSIIANLDSGTNTVNINDANDSTFIVNGGTGVDTVNMAGDLSDYTITNNGDNTLTLINNVSGATTTVDTAVENILLNDGTQITFDGTTTTITDSDGNASNIDISDYNDSTFVVNTSDMNDTVTLGGIGNDITVNLDSGTNTVNIDASTASDYIINGGTGTDTVTLTGNVDDYDVVADPGGLTTFTNIVSGATVTVDISLVENVNAADGSLIGPTVIDGTTAADNIDLTTYSDRTLVVNANSGDDTVLLGGSNNDATINLDSGDNTVNVDDTSLNTFVINGGTGTDTVNLSGNLADYNIVNNWDTTFTFTNIATGTNITVDSSVENIVMNDGTVVSFDSGIGGSTINIVDTDGNASNIDLSAYDGYTFDITTGDQDDTLTLGGMESTYTVDLGSGNNTVNIDDSVYNTTVISGGIGTDTVNLSGNFADYSITNNNDNTITLTNTISGAATTFDTAVESVVLGDGTSINFNGDALTVDDAEKHIGEYDLTNLEDTVLVLNTYDRADIITLGGTNNTVTVNLERDNNIITVDDSSANNFIINGGIGSDTVTFSGNMADYTSVDNGDGTITYTNSISGATTTIDTTTIEVINAADGSLLGTRTFDGTTGDDNIDLTAFGGATIIVNANSGNDTVELGGVDNTATVNLDSGDNVVNVDDTSDNAFVINGGTGDDTVNMAGDLADYSITNNGDNTLTLYNNISGASTTIDNNIEHIVMADGAVVELAGVGGEPSVAITDALGNATTLDLSGYESSTFIINASDMDDTFTVGGVDNNVTLNLDSGDNTVNVNDNDSSTFVINGGTGTDTVNMDGNLTDYSFVDNGDNTVTLTNTISGATTTIDTSVENIVMADGAVMELSVGDATETIMTITDALGNSTDLDLSSYSNSTFVLNASDMDDYITLGGDSNVFTVNLDSGDNTVSIDDSVFNSSIINGGSGTDTVVLTGAYADYTIEDTGTSYLITNTSVGSQITVDRTLDFITFTDGTYTYDQLLGSS